MAISGNEKARRVLGFSNAATIVLLALGSTAAAEALSSADEIIARADIAAYYAGADGRSEVRMIISDAQGREQRRQFTVLRRDVDEAGDQQFLVVLSQPSDVRNTVFLVNKHIDKDDDRWLYLPGLDLVKRVSAGDKRTSFVGAHYFYEDVSGRRPSDDTHELIETSDTFYVLSHTPKEPGSVEFSSYLTWIDRQTFLPMKIEYTNPAGDIYRRVEVFDVTEFDGHPTVTTSRVSDLLTGGKTDMQFRYIKYDVGIPDSVFTERSLRTPPRDWLKRPAE
jgi:outer membrane lipoprotein-sorting protein